MTFDDRLRRELQKAIPSDPPPDPAALADELIRRASGDGSGGGPGRSGGGWRIVLWLAVLAILGGLIGGAIGFSGLLDSEPEATAVTSAPSTTMVLEITTTTVATTTTSAPVETTTSGEAPTSTATTAAPATTPPPAAASDTTPPVISQLSVAPDPIWELDTEGIPCGTYPRQATVSSQVSDDRGVATVTLSWAFPGGPNGSTAMSGSGTYSATFGPFPYLTVTDSGSEPATLTITATDGAGNSAVVLDGITVFSTATCFG